MATPSSRPLEERDAVGWLKRHDREFEQIKREMVKQQKIPPPVIAGGGGASHPMRVESYTAVDEGEFHKPQWEYIETMGPQDYGIPSPPMVMSDDEMRVWPVEEGIYLVHYRLDVRFYFEYGPAPDFITLNSDLLGGGGGGYNVWGTEPVRPDPYQPERRANASLHLSGFPMYCYPSSEEVGNTMHGSWTGRPADDFYAAMYFTRIG